MTRSVSVSQLLDDIQDQADTLGTDLRHTPARLLRKVNQSYQRFRELVTREGLSLFLTPSSGTLTPGVESPYGFRSLDISGVADLVRPVGLDITVNGLVTSLYCIPFEHRNSYGGGTSTSVPEAWAQYNRTSLAILPAPDIAYPYTLWYLPRPDELTANDSFDGVAGWEDWVMWDVVCRLLARDQGSTALAIAQQERAMVQTEIMRSAQVVNRGGPKSIGRDTFGQRHMGRSRGKLLPPP